MKGTRFYLSTLLLAIAVLLAGCLGSGTKGTTPTTKTDEAIVGRRAEEILSVDNEAELEVLKRYFDEQVLYLETVNGQVFHDYPVPRDEIVDEFYGVFTYRGLEPGAKIGRLVTDVSGNVATVSQTFEGVVRDEFGVYDVSGTLQLKWRKKNGEWLLAEVVVTTTINPRGGQEPNEGDQDNGGEETEDEGNIEDDDDLDFDLEEARSIVMQRSQELVSLKHPDQLAAYEHYFCPAITFREFDDGEVSPGEPIPVHDFISGATGVDFLLMLTLTGQEEIQPYLSAPEIEVRGRTIVLYQILLTDLLIESGLVDESDVRPARFELEWKYRDGSWRLCTITHKFGSSALE